MVTDHAHSIYDSVLANPRIHPISSLVVPRCGQCGVVVRPIFSHSMWHAGFACLYLSRPPHFERPRQMQAGQLIHESVFGEMVQDPKYIPQVRIHGEETMWDKEKLKALRMVEEDPYAEAGYILHQLKVTSRVRKEHVDVLSNLASRGKWFCFVVCTTIGVINSLLFCLEVGRRSITDFPDAANILIIALQAELRSVADLNWQRDTITTLATALDAFELLPSYAVDCLSLTDKKELWSTLERQYPKLYLTCRKFTRIFGEATLALGS